MTHPDRNPDIPIPQTESIGFDPRERSLFPKLPLAPRPPKYVAARLPSDGEPSGSVYAVATTPYVLEWNESAGLYEHMMTAGTDASAVRVATALNEQGGDS